ncbi:hypothetical protein EVAR_36272_1 [Eumeta japonica]|uniref:Uncharacterized protein n=1 Tax=Eumeta variegata TaxID=151549 RepID=A0A4C1WVT9_EUMVA|nr:hypothetical protein EVAR_36272_1 [Eumeta japonica]
MLFRITVTLIRCQNLKSIRNKRLSPAARRRLSRKWGRFVANSGHGGAFCSENSLAGRRTFKNESRKLIHQCITPDRNRCQNLACKGDPVTAEDGGGVCDDGYIIVAITYAHNSAVRSR